MVASSSCSNFPSSRPMRSVRRIARSSSRGCSNRGIPHEICAPLPMMYRRWQVSTGCPAPADSTQLPPPFRWDEERRDVIHTDFDARIVRLCGLSCDDRRSILDPAAVYVPDFLGTTFRVLKANECRRYGEYCTRRLVLAAWDRDSAHEQEAGR